jgi:signal transduction histidine kinase/CheY-like chemotaxis protein
MPLTTHDRPIIGFLSTWSVYEGTSIDSYTHTLLQGIRAAASAQNCGLLMGCGISLPGSPRGSRTVWAVPGAGVDFVPVGPWNTDGLIVIPDDFSEAQFDYVQDLIRSGYPVVFTTAEKPGRMVAVDNAGGIRQAFDHLLEHGHRRIAFVAGKSGRGGDSAERLAAYRAALRSAAIEEDERLIAFGEHRREGGRIAMQRILASGVPFTALLASNDLSALGAMEELRASRLSIPEDVAVVGFDDILEARSQLPPLTTVRHPTFTLGYRAVLSLLESIFGEASGESNARVETQLIVRQSCGCRLGSMRVVPLGDSSPAEMQSIQSNLAHVMAEAAFTELRHTPREDIQALCLGLVESLVSSVTHREPACFNDELQRLLGWLETQAEDANAWHSALSALHGGLPGLMCALPRADTSMADELIDGAHLAIAALAQRQTTGALVRHMATSNRLGLMTSQLLAALDVSESAAILADHLPHLGIQHALVALYASRDDDPVSRSHVLLDVGLKEGRPQGEFVTREFPPPGIYPTDSALQLAILPLVVDEYTTGFAAFGSTDLEPCAAIVHNLASALRNSYLYRDALEGRQLAEQANRLKTRFLSMVSHELRTPLSLIVGLSEMVLREQSELPGAARRDLGQITTSAQHLSRLINDVLDLASSEAGQLRILREPLDLAEVLRMAAKIGEQLARERGLTWRAQLPGLGPWVLGDRTRLRQVTLNLISNAVKFTPSGQVALTMEVADQQATISVSDTGVGVPPSEQDAIFQEFHRSERSVDSGYGGLGLGLTISKQLVEKHGGNIGVCSPGLLGSGSTFYFTLPIISASTLQDNLATPLATQGNIVMVLSEGAQATEQLCANLRERGFEVQVCRVDRDPAWLANVTSCLPAALILEEGLASREGWTITGMLKRQPATENIPVVAYSLDIDRDQGELMELNYLHKPLRPTQIAGELARHCGIGDGQPTVLVVDDDPGILDMHRRLVEQSNCRALTAHNGLEALEVLEGTRPDLILLDLMMPEMDGFAVLDALREREGTRDIPVIILTGRVLSEADLERCNRGVAAILGKGLFSATETINHIEVALARHQTLGRVTQRLVRKAMGCIHTRYAESLSREQIASHIGISPDYLTDCFRQELGITPITYLRRYRIHQACDMLASTDLSITQIALAVGFSDGAHFTRTFQREIGVTPRAYRRRAQN